MTWPREGEREFPRLSSFSRECEIDFLSPTLCVVLWSFKLLLVWFFVLSFNAGFAFCTATDDLIGLVPRTVADVLVCLVYCNFADVPVSWVLQAVAGALLGLVLRTCWCSYWFGPLSCWFRLLHSCWCFCWIFPLYCWWCSCWNGLLSCCWYSWVGC